MTEMKRTETLLILTNFINVYAITHKKSDKGHNNNTLKKLLEKLTLQFLRWKCYSISVVIISKSWIFGNRAMKAYSLLSTGNVNKNF